MKNQVVLYFFTNFEDFQIKPASHQEMSLNAMLDQVIAWSGALSVLRKDA